MAKKTTKSEQKHDYEKKQEKNTPRSSEKEYKQYKQYTPSVYAPQGIPTHEASGAHNQTLPGAQSPQAPLPQIPELTEEQRKEIEAKMKEIEAKVKTFEKVAREKFKEYILGIAVLPPEKKGQKEINTVIVVDDSDSKKMSKKELHDKILSILTELGKKDSIVPSVVLSTEMWNACYDGDYRYLQTLAMSTPIFDTGVIGAVKISEVHKSMVLKKFDKYIVSYVAVGGLFTGKGNEKSDIDVFLIVDDTDVKRMTRTELVERLRAIVYQMAFDAAAYTGVKRQLHIQTYLLTDFWDILKDSASPVIFTFLRDGIPFYDRGIYMPWKNLLDMGRIRPSREAIRKFNESGDHFYDSAKKKLLRVGVEDAYYAVLNPAQAALMMKGFAPPTHKETGRLIREIFVDKEKVLEPKYGDILDNMIARFKKWEYGELNELSGKDVEKIMQECELFRKRIDKLYKQIEATNDKETIVTLFDQTAGAAREAIELVGGPKDIANDHLLALFKKHMIETGKVPQTLQRRLEIVFNAKRDFEKESLSKTDIDTAHRESRLFIRAMIEFFQRHELRERERKTVRVKHEKGVAEILLLEDRAFIVNGAEISVAPLTKEGTLGKVKTATREEMDEALKKSKRVLTVSSKLLESLKEHLGSELELLV